MNKLESHEKKLTFKLTSFEGPLDLLLHLIRQNEMNIYDIQMTEITSQYMDYLHQMKELRLDIAGEYLVMAATLMNIKSRLLLPQEQEASSADVDEEDPRNDLVQQLLVHQLYQEIGVKLADLASERELSYSREQAAPPLDAQLGQLRPESTTVEQLQTAFVKILQRKKFVKFAQPQVHPERYNIKSEMNTIRQRLKVERVVAFEGLFPDNIVEHLVTVFLALLELVKIGEAGVQQAANFEPIMITSEGNNVIK